MRKKSAVYSRIERRCHNVIRKIIDVLRARLTAMINTISHLSDKQARGAGTTLSYDIVTSSNRVYTSPSPSVKSTRAMGLIRPGGSDSPDIVDRIIERLIERLFEKVIEKTVEWVVKRIIERLVERIAETVTDKIAERVIQRTEERIQKED